MAHLSGAAATGNAAKKIRQNASPNYSANFEGVAQGVDGRCAAKRGRFSGLRV